MRADTAQPTAPAKAAVVRAVDLAKWMDERPVLEEINLDVEPGQFVAVLGANGAGKSTLLRVLATLIPPSAGELHLFGEPAVGDVPALRTRIGYIAHQSMLYRELSARANLEFFGRLYGVPDVSARAAELLEAVGLADRAEDPVKAFSRGMLQRASIARSLMHRPDLILADEPFAGLDARAAEALAAILSRLHAGGATIVLAHHDVGQALALADQAIVLRAGRVVVDRSARQLDAVTAVREMTAA